MNAMKRGAKLHWRLLKLSGGIGSCGVRVRRGEWGWEVRVKSGGVRPHQFMLRNAGRATVAMLLFVFCDRRSVYVMVCLCIFMKTGAKVLLTHPLRSLCKTDFAEWFQVSCIFTSWLSMHIDFKHLRVILEELGVECLAQEHMDAVFQWAEPPMNQS